MSLAHVQEQQQLEQTGSTSTGGGIFTFSPPARPYQHTIDSLLVSPWNREHFLNNRHLLLIFPLQSEQSARAAFKFRATSVCALTMKNKCAPRRRMSSSSPLCASLQASGSIKEHLVSKEWKYTFALYIHFLVVFFCPFFSALSFAFSAVRLLFNNS